MKINIAFDNFIKAKKLLGCSDKTIVNYKDFNRKFIDSVGLIDIDDLSLNTVQDYLLLVKENSKSIATYATYTRHIKSFLHWACDEYNLDFDYSKIKVPKDRKKDIYLYSANDMQAIFQAIPLYPKWLNLRNKCLIAFMYDSGLRQAEVCTIKKSDIDYTNKTIKVLGKGDKERKVPLGSFTERLLAMYLNSCPYQSSYIFLDKDGNKLTPNAIKKMMNKLKRKLPFEFSSHKLRHNFATNYCIDQYEEKGIMDPYALQVLMGHSDFETTMRYIHLANEVVSCRKNISHLDRINIFPD